jgi:hypothetical protein
MASVPKVEEQACENTAWNGKQEKPPDFMECSKKDCHRTQSEYRTNESATDRDSINPNLRIPLRFVIKKWRAVGAAENNCDQHADEQSREHNPSKDGFRDQNEHNDKQHDNNADWTVDLAVAAQQAHAHIGILRAIRSVLAVTFVTQLSINPDFTQNGALPLLFNCFD